MYLHRKSALAGESLMEVARLRRQSPEQGRVVFETFRDDVNDLPLALYLAGDTEQSRTEQLATLRFD